MIDVPDWAAVRRFTYRAACRRPRPCALLPGRPLPGPRLPPGPAVVSGGGADEDPRAAPPAGARSSHLTAPCSRPVSWPSRISIIAGTDILRADPPADAADIRTRQCHGD